MRHSLNRVIPSPPVWTQRTAAYSITRILHSNTRVMNFPITICKLKFDAGIFICVSAFISMCVPSVMHVAVYVAVSVLSCISRPLIERCVWCARVFFSRIGDKWIAWSNVPSIARDVNEVGDFKRFWPYDTGKLSETDRNRLSSSLALLGAFAALRQETVCFVIPLRPSAWKNSAPAGRIFVNFYMVIKNLSRKS